MPQHVAVWLVLILALVFANLPFINQRIFVIGPKRSPKSIGWCLSEWLLGGLMTLGVGFALESYLGQHAAQGWEFYVALAFLFLTLAFPGFVWRFLRRGGNEVE